jgi:hypothetical protein
MLIVSALLFERPGDPASSTDTDERSRARAANVALAGEGVVTSFIALPDALQVLVADYTSLRDPGNPDKAVADLDNSFVASDGPADDESTLYPTSSWSESHEEKKSRPAESPADGGNAKQKQGLIELGLPMATGGRIWNITTKVYRRGLS